MQRRSKTLLSAALPPSLRILGYLLCCIFVSGCTATKFLKEGETFYAGADIQLKPQGKIDGQRELSKALETLVLPAPNGTILGMRPAVWFYYSAGIVEKKKGFRNFAKNKLGKTPVLLTDATPTETAKVLEGQLNNDGYFKSKVSFEVKTKRKKSEVIYTVILERPYRIRSINYIFLDTMHASKLNEIKTTSLLKENQRYSLELLSAEQQRIQEVVENEGYYYFDDRYLLFKADTTIGKRMVELDLTIEPGIPDRARRIYHVREIYVFPNYTLSNDSLATTGDTTVVDGFKYIDNQNNFRPTIITNAINLKPDSIYKRVNHEYTLSHLMGLNTFKYVNIKYRGNRSDSSGLWAYIYLTPQLKKSLRFMTDVVSKSNNFVGPGMEFTFTNRNIFRGAEMFQFKLNGSYEWQVRNKQTTNLNALEIGVEASLSVPRFITPFNIQYNAAKYLPQTQIKAGYSFQQRLQYFRLNSSNINAGYTWRESTLKTHQLLPIDLTFVQSTKTSKEFDDLLNANPTLKNSFQNQFILGSSYSYTFNTQLSDDIDQKYNIKNVKRSDYYFNGKVDVSGNIANAIQSTKFTEEQKPYLLFNVPYSQYVRTQLDGRYYHQFDKHNKIATRVLAGVGYAYGNAENMPYIKQFSVGGSSSLRAFPARSVGPGTFNFLDTDSILFIDQRADIKLEGNVEYRFDIIKVMKGALFFDAGNIWLIKEDSLRTGGQFNKSKFLQEIAVGTGFGLRFDFNFFVLRFDLAFPLRKPYREEKNRWAIDEINFGNKNWRRENLILNIAIGYPF
ncbi:translocation and assembly module lipoprotein TamL [Chryseotalea sanaruensis]|uniref:translocation and assembly module lipoprotein TamL n=1 Tax=Chryseotalea sanaruensis TaxID=2482724 RepID=UPI000F8ED2A1|nr:BamA/TamA family outer membrane protein [Chryseotalea sanaruensis]